MSDIAVRNTFLKNARGFTVADTATTTWSFDPVTNKLSCAVSVAAGSIADDAITNAKLANMAQATIKGRASAAGTGDPVDLTATQVKTILALASTDISDFTEAAQDAALGVMTTGSRIAFTYNDPSNTLTADIVTASVANSYLADMAQSTIKGRAAGAGTGVPVDLTTSQVRTILSISNVEDTALSTWAGTTNITTVGTIGTGTWNATAIADGKIASTLTGKTYNGLTLTSLATGFTVAGGTTSKTLTVALDANVSGTNSGGANPTGTIGLSAVIGSATTFVRSDGAPALSQAIRPLWTDYHTFQGDVLSASVGTTGIVIGTQSSAAIPAILAVVSGQAANGRLWEQAYSGAHFIGRTLNDAVDTAANWIDVTRSGNTISAIDFGNSTDNPPQRHYGRTGINCVPISSVSFRVEKAGNVDTGFEVFRASATETTLISFDRNGAAYTNFGYDAALHTFRVSGSDAVSISGATTTGAQTATFVATNKPGSGTAGIIAWLPVKTASGTTGYMPIFGA